MDVDIDDERASGHMSSRMSARIEVVAGRRRWTVEQKLSMLRDAFGADGSVRDACERHGIGSGQIYTWRGQAMSGELTGLKAITRGRATFATLAHVVVHKFDHHLPLYRQAEMMAAQSIDIDRSTLAGWAGQAAYLLDPIVSRIREEDLKADKIHVDYTPVPMLVPGKGKAAHPGQPLQLKPASRRFRRCTPGMLGLFYGLLRKGQA